MKKIKQISENYGAIHSRRVYLLDCTKEEKQQLKDALAMFAKIEKILGVKRKNADWTMLHSYGFNQDGVYVTVDQGACG